VTSLFSRFLRSRQNISEVSYVAAPAPWEASLFARRSPEPAVERPGPPLAAFRHLRTGRGNLLCAGPNQVEMRDEGADDALVAVLPDSNHQLVFLLAPDLRALEVRGDGLNAVAISAFRLQTEQPGVMRLRHPLAPQRFLGVTPPGAGGPDGRVIFDSVGAGPLDRFEILRMAAANLSPAFLQVAAEICAAVARPFCAAPLLERLRTMLVRPELAEPLIRMLPREELAELAGLLLQNPDDLLLLRRAMPGNPWFARVLPELSAWTTRRRGLPGGVAHSPAGDEFAGDPFEGYGQPQAGFALTALARATVLPACGACLVTTIRNEGRYFLEFLAYHRSIGFEHAFIYTTDNFDDSTPLLEALAARGVITLVHNQAGLHTGPRSKMHAHALSLLPHILDFRWAALIDADEFIAFDTRRFTSIDDVLTWHETQPVDAVALCNLSFVARACDKEHNVSTLERFVRRERGVSPHVKTIFRPSKYWNARAHYPHASLGMPTTYRTESGTLHHHPGMTDRDPALAARATADMLWINRYAIRTAPELLWKMSRGQPDLKNAASPMPLEKARGLCDRWLKAASRTDLVEDRRILACAASMEEELAGLLGLPGVAEAEAQTRAVYADRLPRMTQAFIDAALPAGQEPQEFALLRRALQQAFP
jgi:hypothetical protein